MTYQWENYDKFVDDTGTIFEKLSNSKYDYRFTTPEGDTDFCSRQQMVSWGVKFIQVSE
tara:strand:- start:4601 stop:4777 length:177 start_codon:yes stop_codon:yes gene_type:complete